MHIYIYICIYITYIICTHIIYLSLPRQTRRLLGTRMSLVSHYVRASRVGGLFGSSIFHLCTHKNRWICWMF